MAVIGALMTQDNLPKGGDLNGGNGHKAWRLTREKILMFAGLTLIAASFINSEVFGGIFHIEYVGAGLALCGISITQWGDKK
jgi:hypothetical protein